MFAKDPGRKEFPVLPLDDIVVFPQTRTKLKVDKETGEQLAAALQAGGPATAVALAVPRLTQATRSTSSAGH